MGCLFLIWTFNRYDSKGSFYLSLSMFSQNHATGHIRDIFFTHWKDGWSASLNLILMVFLVSAGKG
jgi:hypothetical protein